MKIYLARNNEQAGPYTLDQLNHMLASGEVVMDDLMWHTGMTAWQKVGEMTGGQMHYQPKLDASMPPPYIERREPRGFGDNVDFNPNQDTQGEQKRRVSVAELYGRKPAAEEPSRPVAPPPPEPDEWMGRHCTSRQAESQAGQDVQYASVMTRFLATCINMILFGLSMAPFIQGFVATNPDPDKMNNGDLADRMAYAQTIAERIDPTNANLTLMLVLGLLIMQTILLCKRGQSLGKLVTGIRVVNADTGMVADAGKLLGMRGALLVLIYWLASMIPPGLGLIAMCVNYVMAAMSPTKQGWHDRFAKTKVVKAHDSQLPSKK